MPIFQKLKKLLLNNKSKINFDNILNWGDDYELIFTTNREYRNKIFSLAKKNNVKLSIVGTIIKKKGIFDDSMSLIKNVSSFDHFC